MARLGQAVVISPVISVVKLTKHHGQERPSQWVKPDSHWSPSPCHKHRSLSINNLQANNASDYQ